MAGATIIFVHGLGGEPKDTWGRFPELIKSDLGLKNVEIYLFGFPTSLFNWWPWSSEHPKIQTLADALRTQIDTRFAGRRNFVLVCHSLGGLIGRRYLVDLVKRKEEVKVKNLLLYAVPNNASSLADLATHVSWQHNQLRQLCKNSDLIRDLDADWAIFEMAGRVQTRYVVAGLDRVVDELSARSSWGERNVDVVADRGHIDLVKPRGSDDTPYLILRKSVQSLVADDPAKQIERYAMPSTAVRLARPRGQAGYRVIGFDLDGTLLRGIQFSWTAVWQHLGFPEAVYQGAMRDYRKGRITYQEWCDLAVAQFRTKGLRRTDFAKIAAGMTVTKKLDETISTLKTAGFVTALISGGIDTLLEEKIPNAAELFDYVCINRLKFDQPSGLVSGVEATPFDFAGKTDALDAICQRHGCSLNEAVFVGEGFNDEDVVNRAGLSIAYPPGETAIDAAAMKVEQDDLSEILKHVLGL